MIESIITGCGVVVAVCGAALVVTSAALIYWYMFH